LATGERKARKHGGWTYQRGEEANVIGVIANLAEHAVISEFFELFKTPWEFYQSDRQYEVLLCAGNSDFAKNTAKLVLIYASENLAFGFVEKVEIASRKRNRMLLHRGARLPIYGDGITFREKETDLLIDEESRQTAMQQYKSPDGMVVRIGYDLFGEVASLLTEGQPVVYADIPTLDLHIFLLRDLIVTSGVSLVEVPPIPDGYRSIACLTHDVDHPSICRHKWDHTMFGFLYRAILGSLVNLFRGRISVRDLLKNWTAALKLPFVYMGFAKDFWSNFDDRYLKLEKGLCSTFFVIPFKNDPGKESSDLAPTFRAARYGAQDIADTIEKIKATGCEIGLHGIDAWLDSTKGQAELEEIRHLTGESQIGVRMHWLYHDLQSAAALESAGAAYDSTVGYKETVGYRAGTTQAYKPLQVDRLLELPMHVMDTALFYPAYMGLSQKQATQILRRLIDNVSHFGGCLTINWHDRSLAPERLWDASYQNLIQDLKNRDAWFATAGQAVSWFRKRRSVVFQAVGAKVTAYPEDFVPGLRLRVYNPRELLEINGHESGEYFDMAFNESIGKVSYGAGR
jgi:hypothetical protein